MTKITVDSKSFVEALQWATKNFDGRDADASVALVIDAHGKGSLFHANTSSFLKSNFTVLDSDLKPGEDFKLSLQGQYVQRLASNLDPTGPSELRYDSTSLKLKNKLGNFTLPTLTGSIGSEPVIQTLGEVDNLVFFDTLQRLAKLTDPASAGLYPVLGTVDLAFDFENNSAVLMGTDRYTLGEIAMDFTPRDDAPEILEGKVNLLLPYSSAVLISPMKGAVASVELVYEPKQGKFGYSFTDGKVAIFSIQDAEPLQYRSLKEASSSNIVGSVQLSTKELQRAIGVISSLVPDENEIYFTFSEDGLVVADAHQSQQVTVDLLDSEIPSEETAKFVRSVINKAFPPISTGVMNIKWELMEKPFIFEPVLDDGTVASNVFVLAIPSS